MSVGRSTECAMSERDERRRDSVHYVALFANIIIKRVLGCCSSTMALAVNVLPQLFSQKPESKSFGRVLKLQKHSVPQTPQPSSV